MMNSLTYGTPLKILLSGSGQMQMLNLMCLNQYIFTTDIYALR